MLAAATLRSEVRMQSHLRLYETTKDVKVQYDHDMLVLTGDQARGPGRAC